MYTVIRDADLNPLGATEAGQPAAAKFVALPFPQRAVAQFTGAAQTYEALPPKVEFLLEGVVHTKGATFEIWRLDDDGTIAWLGSIFYGPIELAKNPRILVDTYGHQVYVTASFGSGTFTSPGTIKARAM